VNKPGSWLIPATLALTAACSSPPPATSSAPLADSAQTTLAARSNLAIGTVAPERLALSGDRVDVQTLTVSYSIPDPATVTEARLKLYVGEIGDIATQTVTPAEKGTTEFALQPTPHSVGPWVRFRASCPNGTTDWHALGQITPDYDERMSTAFRIGNVMPQSIPWSEAMTDSQSGAGKRVKIWGPGLPADCRIEAEVNGSPVELNNVMYLNRQYEGLLMYRDIGYSTVSPRYAELKLVINRSGHRVMAIKRLAFLEP
jgi:hypothetical protein